MSSPDAQSNTSHPRTLGVLAGKCPLVYALMADEIVKRSGGLGCSPGILLLRFHELPVWMAPLQLIHHTTGVHSTTVSPWFDQLPLLVSQAVLP